MFTDKAFCQFLLMYVAALDRLVLLSTAICNIYINAFITKLREVNTGCSVNGVLVGCIMYTDDLILISATVNGLQSMSNCCYNVSVNLMLKFNYAKSSCIAIGNGHAFNISNMQLGNDLISWSSSLKYLCVTFNVGKNCWWMLMS